LSPQFSGGEQESLSPSSQWIPACAGMTKRIYRMRIAYFDCFSGISGDMTLGALLDLGFPESSLREGLAALPVGGYRI